MPNLTPDRLAAIEAAVATPMVITVLRDDVLGEMELAEVGVEDVRNVLSDLRAARQEATEAREALGAAVEHMSKLAGMTAGLLDNGWPGCTVHPYVLDALRGEIKARAILGLEPEAVLSDDFSPWAIAMRAATEEEKADG